jgi:hypothetical protein
MAHYAFLDENNVVTEVIVGIDEDDDSIDWEAHYGAIRGQTCLRTSYNTTNGTHVNGGVPFRKNFAGIGYTYDPERDAFIPPKYYASWVLNEDTAQWEPPIPLPERGNPPKQFMWDEETLSWKAR